MFPQSQRIDNTMFIKNKSSDPLAPIYSARVPSYQDERRKTPF